MKCRKRSNALVLVICNICFHLFGAGIFMVLDKSVAEDAAKIKSENRKINEKLLSNLFTKNASMTTLEHVAKLIELNQRNEQIIPVWKSIICPTTYLRWLCFVLITSSTIGYGKTVPQSDGSKIFVIFFALFAIPLHLSCLALVGNRLKTCANQTVQYLEWIIYHHRAVKRNKEKTFAVLFVVMWLWILGGTTGVHYVSKWNFLDSFYFIFATYTTIGYGDFVFDISVSPFYDAIIAMHTTVGLALVASVIDGLTDGMLSKKTMQVENCNHTNIIHGTWLERFGMRSNAVFSVNQLEIGTFTSRGCLE